MAPPDITFCNALEHWNDKFVAGAHFSPGAAAPTPLTRAPADPFVCGACRITHARGGLVAHDPVGYGFRRARRAQTSLAILIRKSCLWTARIRADRHTSRHKSFS